MAPVLLGWAYTFAQPFWLFLFFVLDIAFLVDCHIHAHTCYIDDYGIPILDPKETRKRYLIKHRGWLDIGFSLPFDLLAFSGVSLMADAR